MNPHTKAKTSLDARVKEKMSTIYTNIIISKTPVFLTERQRGLRLMWG